MTSETRWLNAQEEHLWRAWTRLNSELSAKLQRQMQQDAKLSMSDYEVLVHLTDSPEGRVRVSDLATLLQWERSRVSHHLTRMERRGLVERSECSEDGRGAFIAVTGAGRASIEQAAPGHAAAVSRLVFDALDEDEVAGMTTAVDTLLAHLDDLAGAATSTPGAAQAS